MSAALVYMRDSLGFEAVASGRSKTQRKQIIAFRYHVLKAVHDKGKVVTYRTKLKETFFSSISDAVDLLAQQFAENGVNVNEKVSHVLMKF